MLQTLTYHVRRGEYWQRLVTIKDNRTHRVFPVTIASCFIQAPGATVKIPVACTVTNQGGILLTMSEDDTLALIDGDYSFDLAADPLTRVRIVARGTITVSSVAQVTPFDGAFNMEIDYKQRTDFRLDFDWTDDAGVLITVQSARMQARDKANTPVLDLHWFSSTPNESTISALPAIQRGYLAPKTGKTLEMHISDTNTIAAGSYAFDMQGQDGAGDWDCIASGTIVVEASITDRSL